MGRRQRRRRRVERALDAMPMLSYGNTMIVTTDRGTFEFEGTAELDGTTSFDTSAIPVDATITAWAVPLAPVSCEPAQ